MLQKCSVWQVLEAFFDDPETELSLNETSRRTKLAHTSVKQHLLALEKEAVILVEKKRIGSRIYPLYKADTSSPAYKRYKTFDIIEKLYASGLIKRLLEESPDCIILFGSASRGEDIKTSDIDLFVKAKKADIELKKYESILHRKIELHFQEHLKQFPKELRNNIVNGIKLEGFLEIE